MNGFQAIHENRVMPTTPQRHRSRLLGRLVGEVLPNGETEVGGDGSVDTFSNPCL
jgi:hypothetical protein